MINTARFIGWYYLSGKNNLQIRSVDHT